MTKRVSSADDVELALRLYDQGVPLETVAEALGQPLDLLRERTRSTSLTPEDKQLASGMRQLAWKAWGFAMWTLENGTPDAKMSIAKTVLSKVAGLIGEERTTTYEETRAAVEGIWAEMRNVPVAPAATDLPLPESDTPDAAPAPAPRRAVHSDKEARRDQGSLRPPAEPDRG